MNYSSISTSPLSSRAITQRFQPRGVQLITMIAIMLISSLSNAITLSADKDFAKIDLYGFIKADAVYQGSGMNSSYAPRWANETESGTGNGDGEFNMTAMQSRFGFKWLGVNFDSGTKLSAQLEWDLFSDSGNQMKFRNRIAAIKLSKNKHSLLIGQHWDLFSPLNVTTLMTNGNFWQTGNLGFRRAQFRYTYQGDQINFAASVNDGTRDGIRENKLPLLESRLGATLGGHAMGISFAYGEETIAEEDHDVLGVSVDWKFALSSKLMLQGELAGGENLKVFLSRSGVATEVSTEDAVSQEVSSGWMQLKYKGKQCALWLGAAIEVLDDATLTADDMEDTQAIFLGFKHSYEKGFSAAIELGVFETTLMSGETQDANQVIFSGIYGF